MAVWLIPREKKVREAKVRDFKAREGTKVVEGYKLREITSFRESILVEMQKHAKITCAKDKFSRNLQSFFAHFCFRVL